MALKIKVPGQDGNFKEILPNLYHIYLMSIPHGYVFKHLNTKLTQNKEKARKFSEFIKLITKPVNKN